MRNRTRLVIVHASKQPKGIEHISDEIVLDFPTQSECYEWEAAAVHSLSMHVFPELTCGRVIVRGTALISFLRMDQFESVERTFELKLDELNNARLVQLESESHPERIFLLNGADWESSVEIRYPCDINHSPSTEVAVELIIKNARDLSKEGDLDIILEFTGETRHAQTAEADKWKQAIKYVMDLFEDQDPDAQLRNQVRATTKIEKQVAKEKKLPVVLLNDSIVDDPLFNEQQQQQLSSNSRTTTTLFQEVENAVASSAVPSGTSSSLTFAASSTAVASDAFVNFSSSSSRIGTVSFPPSLSAGSSMIDSLTPVILSSSSDAVPAVVFESARVASDPVSLAAASSSSTSPSATSSTPTALVSFAPDTSPLATSSTFTAPVSLASDTSPSGASSTASDPVLLTSAASPFSPPSEMLCSLKCPASGCAVASDASAISPVSFLNSASSSHEVSPPSSSNSQVLIFVIFFFGFFFGLFLLGPCITGVSAFCSIFHVFFG